MTNKNRIFSNKISIKEILLLALICCAVFQFLITQYFTIFEGQEHLGYDASWEYMKVIMADRHGSLYPKEFMHETTQPEMERILFVLPFYKLTGNIWLAYGLGNILLTGIMLYVLWQIMKNIGFKTITKLVIINLFLCPYLSNGFSTVNDLSYFSCLHAFSPYQNVVMVAYLLSLWIVTIDKLDRKAWIVFAITVLFTAYQCLCKGLGGLVWSGVPILFYVLFQVFYRNDIKIMFKWKNLMLLAIFVSMFVGRILGQAIGYSYIDSGMNWINASKFWTNFGNIILGFMALVGAVPGSDIVRSPSEYTGIVYIFGIIIFTVILVSFAYGLVLFIGSLIKKQSVDDIWCFSFILIIVNIVEFMFIDTSYGQDIFELRYLMDALMIGFLLVGKFIESLDDTLLFKKAGVITLSLAIAGMNLWSDYFLAITDNSSWKVDEVADVINSTDAELIVFWDSEKEFSKTEKVLRVVDSDRVYKCISRGNYLDNFGDYNYYDDCRKYEGATILIVNDSKPVVPSQWLEKYTVLDTIGDMRICYSKENPIDIINNVMNDL